MKLILILSILFTLTAFAQEESPCPSEMTYEYGYLGKSKCFLQLPNIPLNSRAGLTVVDGTPTSSIPIRGTRHRYEETRYVRKGRLFYWPNSDQNPEVSCSAPFVEVEHSSYYPMSNKLCAFEFEGDFRKVSPYTRYFSEEGIIGFEFHSREQQEQIANYARESRQSAEALLGRIQTAQSESTQRLNNINSLERNLLGSRGYYGGRYTEGSFSGDLNSWSGRLERLRWQMSELQNDIEAQGESINRARRIRVINHERSPETFLHQILPETFEEQDASQIYASFSIDADVPEGQIFIYFENNGSIKYSWSDVDYNRPFCGLTIDESVLEEGRKIPRPLTFRIRRASYSLQGTGHVKIELHGVTRDARDQNGINVHLKCGSGVSQGHARFGLAGGIARPIVDVNKPGVMPTIENVQQAIGNFRVYTTEVRDD